MFLSMQNVLLSLIVFNFGLRFPLGSEKKGGKRKPETGKGKTEKKLSPKRNGTIFLLFCCVATRSSLLVHPSCNPAQQTVARILTVRFFNPHSSNMIWNWALLALGALPFCTAQQTITVRFPTVSCRTPADVSSI